jgi:hypothetical protein
MATPVVTFLEIDKVGTIYKVLTDTRHNGYPVVDSTGRLRGLVLRKTLTTLLKLKAFSGPERESDKVLRKRSLSVTLTGKTDSLPDNAIQLAAPATTAFYADIERQYPDYPTIESVSLTEEELVFLFVFVRNLTIFYDFT